MAERPRASDPLDDALRAAFGAGPGESVLERIERRTGVRSRLLLHDAPDGESPVLRILRVGGGEVTNDSRHEIAGEIARGGVGVVYKGRDRDLGRDVAMKVLRAEHARDPQVVDRFVEEAQIGAQLAHPGIVPVYALGLQPDGRPFFSMKLVKGRTLAALLKERAGPGDDRRGYLRIFERVCQTISYAHSRGVIHRDLKPSNVMVGAFGEVLVVDWGFGKVLGRRDTAAELKIERTVVATVRSGSDGSQSIAGSVMGTPAYMPPEQALGHVAELDEQSDVFSLGAILCQILTGEPPYVGAPKDLLVMASQARLEGAVERLEGCGADAEIVALARRCLEPMRGDRPAHAGEVAEAISDHLAAAEERAHRAEIGAIEEREGLERERRRAAWERSARRKTVVAAAAVLLAAVLGGGAWWWTSAKARARAEKARPGVETALEEASRLREKKRWPEALAAATRARDLAVSGEVDPGLRDRAEALVKEVAAVRARAQAATRRKDEEAAFVAELNEIRIDRGNDFDIRRYDRLNVEAFSRRGVDVESLPPDEAARRLRDGFPEATTDLAEVLRDWANLRRYYKDELGRRDPDRLEQIARALDPDPWRERLRRAVADEDRDALRAIAHEARTSALPASARDRLGWSLLAVGETDLGVQILQGVLAERPGDFWAHNYLAWTQSGHGRAAEAITQYTEALALRPESASLWHTLGHALERAGRQDEALVAFRKMVRLDPTDAKYCTCLGFELVKRGEGEEAVQLVRAAIARRPDDPDTRTGLGGILVNLGRLDEAEPELREAIRLAPNHEEAHRFLGNLWFKRGRSSEALECFQTAHRLDPSARTLSLLAAARVARGDLAEALDLLHEGVRRYPDSTELLCTLAWALSVSGDEAGATEAYQEGVRLGAAYAHVGLAAELASEGNYEEAIDHLERARELGQGGLDVHLAGFRRCIALSPRLSDYLAGRWRPETLEDRQALAFVCEGKELWLQAARLHDQILAGGLAAARDVTNDLLRAADCAAQAATAESATLTADERKKWHEKARAWLRAGLARKRELTPWIGPDLVSQLEDPDFEAVRDEAALAKLPAEEREAWTALWTEVREALEEFRNG